MQLSAAADPSRYQVTLGDHEIEELEDSYVNDFAQYGTGISHLGGDIGLSRPLSRRTPAAESSLEQLNWPQEEWQSCADCVDIDTDVSTCSA